MLLKLQYLKFKFRSVLLDPTGRSRSQPLRNYILLRCLNGLFSRVLECIQRPQGLLC